jgi:5-methylcytosine-specific restriction endonuclease McrA
MTRKRKALIFAAHNGVCYLCGGKIGVGEAWDAEHQIPWEISRDDSDDNLRPAHKKCHAVKTSRDRKDIAKVHRMAAKHNGTWPKTRAPLRSRGFSPTRSILDRPTNNHEIQDGDHE